MDLVEKGLLCGAVAVIGVTFFFAAAPARTIAGNIAIPTTTKFVAIKHAGAADGTVQLKATKDIPAGTVFDIDILDNQLSEKPEGRAARDALGFSIKERRIRAVVETYHFPGDIGTWAGYAGDAGKGDTFQVGFRFSPVRLLWGTTAPDALVSKDHVGVGLSFYPPPDLVGNMWSHWGIGYGHLWPTHSDNSSNVLYLSFSTQIP